MLPLSACVSVQSERGNQGMKSMHKVTLACALAMLVLGISAWSQSAGNSLTALIPAAVGGVLGLLGLAMMRLSLRRYAMHGAMLVAELGAFASLWRGIPSAMDAPVLSLAARTQLFMGALLLAYLAAMVHLYIRNRRVAAV